MKKVFLIFVFVVFSFGAALAYAYRSDVRVFFLEMQKADLPEETRAAVALDESKKEVDGNGAEKLSEKIAKSETEKFTGKADEIQPMARKTLSESINLAMPFSSQAPFHDWGLPYQEACEEMSAILVDAFVRGQWGKGKVDPGIADSAVKKLVEWEQKTFGFYRHTTAEDTARILREYFGHKNAEVRYDISLNDLTRELAAGRPVIVPLAGRKVGNKFYRQPGPVYHMLVVKGYTKDGRIITNDVGTQHGENYPYDSDVFFDAIHDAPSSGDGNVTEEEILRGRKAMIVVK